MASFRFLVEGVEDNNRTNGSSWSVWAHAADIISTYGPLDDEDVSFERAIAVLNRAIESDGKSLALDLAQIEFDIKGQNFDGGGAFWFRTEQLGETVEAAGRIYALTQQPHVDADPRGGENIYRAPAVDAEGDQFRIVWAITQPDAEDESDACDWTRFDVYTAGGQIVANCNA